MDSSALQLQISFLNLAMKSGTRIDAWIGLDLAETQSSMFMCSCTICSILHQNLQSTAWSAPNDDQGTRICNKIQVLCEENWNLRWEQKWREISNLDLECVVMKILLGFSIYTLS
jgi:hypothetical protein